MPPPLLVTLIAKVAPVATGVDQHSSVAPADVLDRLTSVHVRPGVVTVVVRVPEPTDSTNASTRLLLGAVTLAVVVVLLSAAAVCNESTTRVVVGGGSGWKVT